MNITPSSSVTLYGGVEVDGRAGVVFASRAEQLAYYSAHAVLTDYPCTYIRRTGAVRLQVALSTVMNCNMLSFINPAFENRTYYARIIDFAYVNNETVDIFFSVEDPASAWQTYMFDAAFDTMHIAREHLSQADETKADTNPYDPTILELHTAESLPVGEDLEKPIYQIDGETAVWDNPDGFSMLVATDPQRVRNGWGTLVITSIFDWDSIEGARTYLEDFRTKMLYGDPDSPTYPWQGLLSFMKEAGRDAVYIGGGYGQMTDPRLGTNFDGAFDLWYIQDSSGLKAIDITPQALINEFTRWGLADNVLAVYRLPNRIAAASIVNGTTTPGAMNLTVETSKTRHPEVRNHKLLLYPFSYMRLVAPNGDRAELRYELFRENQVLGLNRCLFTLQTDLMERPKLLAMPRGYKMRGQDYNSTGENLLDGIIFDQIPTSPFNVSGWIAQVASLAAATLANATEDYQYDIAQQALTLQKGQTELLTRPAGILGDAGSIAGKVLSGDIGGAAGGLLSAPGKYATMGIESTQYGIARDRLQYTENRMQDAYNALSASELADDNRILKDMNYQRPLYAAHKYHPSTGDGVINYSYAGFMDIILIHVQLAPVFIEQYEKFFDMFGYSSGRCGRPHVLDYVQGGQDLPSWHPVDGKRITYVQTSDCHIYNLHVSAARAIEALFDGGYRFINPNPEPEPEPEPEET